MLPSVMIGGRLLNKYIPDKSAAGLTSEAL